MIALTTPHAVNSVLGGDTPINYDHVVLSPITFNPIARTVTATVRLTSTVSPNMDVVTGSLTVDLGPGILVFKVEQLDILRRMQLSGAQITAVQNILNSAQNQIESGLISVGVVAGTQSTGA